MPEGVVKFPLGLGTPDGVIVSIEVTIDSGELSVGAADTTLVSVLLSWRRKLAAISGLDVAAQVVRRSAAAAAVANEVFILIGLR